MSKVLYRYEIRYKSYDNETGICLLELPVVRETERTYFIKRYIYGSNGSNFRRVSKDGDDYGYNAYAYSSKKKAKDHFIRRTKKRLSWFKFWTSECEKGLKLMEES